MAVDGWPLLVEILEDTSFPPFLCPSFASRSLALATGLDICLSCLVDELPLCWLLPMKEFVCEILLPEAPILASQCILEEGFCFLVYPSFDLCCDIIYLPFEALGGRLWLVLPLARKWSLVC